MNVQQEIIECEQELSSLLERVLVGTLKPIEASLKASEDRLGDLEDEVRTMLGSSQEVSLQQQASLRDLKRLKSQTEDGQRETVVKVNELLVESRTSLIAAQTQSHASLGDGLQRHAAERAQWIARTLGGQLNEGAAQQQLNVVESRDVLVGHVLELQTSGKAIEHRLAEAIQHLSELRQTARSLESLGQAVQSDGLEARRQAVTLHEQWVRQSRSEIEIALRPIRRMLAIALALAGGGMLLAAARYWSLFLN